MSCAAPLLRAAGDRGPFCCLYCRDRSLSSTDSTCLPGQLSWSTAHLTHLSAGCREPQWGKATHWSRAERREVPVTRAAQPRGMHPVHSSHRDCMGIPGAGRRPGERSHVAPRSSGTAGACAPIAVPRGCHSALLQPDPTGPRFCPATPSKAPVAQPRHTPASTCRAQLPWPSCHVQCTHDCPDIPAPPCSRMPAAPIPQARRRTCSSNSTRTGLAMWGRELATPRRGYWAGQAAV